jgi:hypothetical protein
MDTAFGFFGNLLEAIKRDTRLTILWGFGVLLFVCLVVLLVLAPDLHPTAKAILIGGVILILPVLFIYTVPRLPDQQFPKQLIALLEDRAEAVITTIAEKNEVLKRGSRGGTGPGSNHAKIQTLNNAQARFESLHKKHIECLRAADFTRAHELCRTIRELLAGLEAEFGRQIQPGLLYKIEADMFTSQFASYPGSRPNDISNEVSTYFLDAVWPPDRTA